MNSSLEAQFIEEDPSSLANRRRNNVVIFVFLCIIISLALILASTFFYLLHSSISDSDPPPLSPAVRAYYSVASSIPSCLDLFMEIVSVKSDADPDLIFSLTLESAAEDLDTTLNLLILPYSDAEPAYRNCAGSLLPDGSVQIRLAVAALRVNPSVERRSGEERSEMVKWIAAAEGNLDSCLDDLWMGESRAVKDAREKVLRVKAYVRSGGEFLARHDVVMRRFRGEIGAGLDWRSSEVLKDAVVLCMSALYFFFLLWILKGICRFVGLKFPSLGNVFRSLFAGAIWRR